MATHGGWAPGVVLFAGPNTMSVRLDDGRNVIMPTLDGAQKGGRLFVGGFDGIGRATLATFDGTTAPPKEEPPLYVPPPPAKLTPRIAKLAASLAEVGVLDAMPGAKLAQWVAEDWDLPERASAADLAIAAHNSDTCTKRSGARCPHRAMIVEDELESDVNFDGDTFGQLKRLLGKAKVAVKVRGESTPDGVVATVTQGTWSASANLDDAKDSVAALIKLLDEGCKRAGSDLRFHRVRSRHSTNSLLLLRNAKELEAIAAMLPSGKGRS